ncbi:hypothetical protein N8Z10_00955 [bacterium]|nr:hypothetical protein [bacterium]
MNPLLKKLIREYNYLNETLGDVKEISSLAEGKFKSALMEVDPNAIEALVPKTQDINLEDDNVSMEEVEMEIKHNDPRFKKLFRKIAVKCHPDKLGNIVGQEAEHLKKIYGELITANQNYDWAMLLNLAVGLDIEFDDLSDEEIVNVNDNIDVLRKEILKYENSMAYSWYTKNDENSRKEYLAACAKIFNKSLED